MADKIEITDEMVERACHAAYQADGHDNTFAGAYHTSQDQWRYFIRAGLDAALNPPPEPEIPVTEEMIEAGSKIVYSWHNTSSTISLAESVYRAMRKLEPKPGPICEVKSTRQLSYHWHHRSEIGPSYSHRRKDDP